MGWLFPFTAHTVSPQLGDLNNDGTVDMLDLVILINHLNGVSLLPSGSLPLADLNDDGRVTLADADALGDAILGLPPTITPKPVSIEPGNGSSEVGVSVRPKVTFPKPIQTSTLNANNFYASFAGQKLPTTIVPASDGTFAWLFLNSDMPSASQIQVIVDGSTIRTMLGLPVDASGNGTAGSKATFSFSTVSVTPIPNTVMAGQIVDPGPDLKPRTGDDILFGPDGLIYTRPIEGVMVYILGMEDLATFTDANGYFSLNPVPVGDVKLVTDGRTATTPRGDFYWPEMVMDAHVEPGITNYWMFNRDSKGQIIRDANGVPIPVTTMYLPRIASNALQTVSAANTTMITLNSNAAYTLRTNQQQYLTLEIMPHSLVGMNGQPMSTAQIGISVVPPELVRDMLPPGLLQHTFDITVQAPGIATFSTPAAMTFPNVFNAPPGSKLNFLSFDHTTGRLVIDGTATVSADGLYVTTDPGTGVTHPGWHGLAPPGDPVDGGTNYVGNPPPQDCTPMTTQRDLERCPDRVQKKNVISDDGCHVWLDFPVDIVIWRDACKNHNICYDTCAQGDEILGHKNLCDGVFLDSMISSCNQYYSDNPVLRAACIADSYIAYGIVQGRLGQIAYLEGQLKGCLCCPPVTAKKGAEVISSIPANGVLFYMVREWFSGNVLLRGRTDSHALIPRLFLSANSGYRVYLFDPASGLLGHTDLVTPDSGGSVVIRSIYLQPDSSRDSDSDGLTDLAELVIGTDPTKFSTAGDGISDGAKVAQGVDPLSGRPLATGPIANLSLPGEAKEVVLEGSVLNSAQQTAYVALGSRGLGIVNASQFQMPILLGQLDLPGDATDVAADSNLRIAAVAANAGGLHLVNVADPMQPRLLQTIAGAVSQVEVINGVAYAAFGAGINAYDLLTGEVLETLALGGGTMTGMAREGAFLYSMDSGRVLRVIDISGSSGPYMVLRGSLTMPAGGGKLFVGNGIAYVCAANGTTAGFATASVSNPDAPTLISGVDAPNVEGGAIAANGSGLAVAVGYLRGPVGQSFTALDVLNVSDPANTGGFITRFNLPVTPLGVALGSGIAFVADGTAGLQVVNYRSFDNQGISPTLSIAPPDDRDANAPGLQVEEGSLITVGAQVSDDVQVRNVELLLNGQVVVNDVSFPWDLSTRVPLLSSGTNMVTLQVRATDTGGNVATSSVLTVTMIRDVTPPRLRHTFPNSGTIADSVSSVFFDFSEAIDQNSLTGSSFVLAYAGPDNRLDTADDSVVTNGVLSYQASINAALFSFASPLPYGLYRATIFSNITDLAGNRFASNVSSIFYVLPGGPTGDPDHDDLTNAEEIQRGTNPLLADTDADGWDDGLEVADRTNPLDPNSKPQVVAVANPPIRLEIAAPDQSAAGLTLASPPVTLNLPSLSDGGGFGIRLALPPLVISIPASAGEAAGVSIAQPPLQLILPDSEPSATGLTVAQPPVTLNLPSDAGGNGLGIWTAAPPLLVSLPSSLSGAVGVTVAQPPVDLLLPITASDASGVSLAMPPITVKFANGTSNLFFLNTPSPKGNNLRSNN